MPFPPPEGSKPSGGKISDLIMSEIKGEIEILFYPLIIQSRYLFVILS
jgi:hypothetical protein